MKTTKNLFEFVSFMILGILIGLVCGALIERSIIYKKAVTRGCASWMIDENGKSAFTWKDSGDEVMDEIKTPECDKLSKISDQSQIIGEFLEWLTNERSIQICILDNFSGKFLPYRFSMEQLLAEYFDIDLDKVEQERRLILKNLRSKSDNSMQD